MNSKEKLIERLKKEKIPFKIVRNNGYIKPAVSIQWHTRKCTCPYRNEEFFEETGEPLCAGTAFPNELYEGPEDEVLYEYKGENALKSFSLEELEEEVTRRKKNGCKKIKGMGKQLTR